MKNINQENDLPQQHIQRRQDHQEEEEKLESNHQEDEEQSVEDPKHQENQERETDEFVEEEEEEEEKKQEESEEPQSQHKRDTSLPLTTMPSSPPLSPMSPPPNKPSSPPYSAPSPHHTSYPAHAVSPPPSTLSSYQTSYSYNYNHVESSPPPSALKTPPSPPPSTTKLEGVEERAGVDGVSGSGRRLRPNLSILRRAKMENIKRRSLLVFRIFAFLFCLVSLSVMAADKNQGWALDSFHRYKEFRYCMSVNVIGFVYSGLQASALAYSLTTGKEVVRNQFRCLLDFSLDQILAYLLLSASSSSAFRVEDWESNWGKDKFPAMARASLAFSFLAFVAFAFSSLLSGYTLFTPHSW